jgi:two-component system sensor histidine kinase KdpD
VALSAREEEMLREFTYLALDLGGEFVELAGADPAAEIIEFAKSQQVTFVVMGQSARSRFDEVVRGSIVNRIMRETRNIDIVVVADMDRARQSTDEDDV